MFLRMMLMVFVLTVQTSFVSAATGTDSHRARCKSNKARAYVPILKSGVKFKPNYEELNSKLEKLNTDQFCDCLYDGFEKSFGVEKINEMMQMQYSPPGEQLIRENNEKDRIEFMCFGKQIGKPNLTPPTVEETRQALAKLDPNPLPRMIQKTKVKLRQVHNIIKMHQGFENKNINDLTELTTAEVPLLTAKDLQDAWGHDFEFKRLGAEFELRSAGPDGRMGTVDDIKL